MRTKCGLSKIAFALLLLITAVPAFAQYQKALPGYAYRFPRDYFNHPEYQTEWWYYTGNLRAADGRKFGFELTFFRQGVNRTNTPASDWDVRDIYLAHLALSDLDGGRFYHTERMNRAGPGLAGASESWERVWNGNWQVQWSGDRQSLQAVSQQFSLNLEMAPRKPVVFHGKNGVSQKGAGMGQASHYFSFTRLLTKGTIDLNGKQFAVDGTAWMDHEFFTNPVDTREHGWDWVSLQLDDNTELMLYRFRRKDGTVDPFSAGTYVDAAGISTFLGAGDFSMQPGAALYRSPETQALYPVAWRISVPSLGIELQIATPLKSQEIVSGTGNGLSYWEGAITISGTRGGNPANGAGYLEMTGYAMRSL